MARIRRTKHMIAIKNWFMEKNDYTWMRNWKWEQVKETEKAICIRVTDKTVSFCTETYWIPKSCIIEKWEKDTSNFAYHRYLEDTYHRAYDAGIIPNKTFKSGRNTYRGDAFIHQLTTKSLIKNLEFYNIEFMDRKTWNNREEG